MADRHTSGVLSAFVAAAAAFPVLAQPAAADDVVYDDQIVAQSQCVGADCVDGETFGYTTIRLRQADTRIDFVDTSNSASFPTEDWRLQANDSDATPDGKSYFAIVDGIGGLDSGPDNGGNQVFRIDAGAPANSLYVNATGNVGIGTNNPSRDLTITSGKRPTIRLLQDRSSGKSLQKWDLAVNNVGFSVNQRANKLGRPFQVESGAPNNALVLKGNGRVGIGVVNPQAGLHTTGSVMFSQLSGCAAGIKSDASGNLSCITSSARFKIVTGALAPEAALANVMALKPQVGTYKKTPGESEHWVIAEDAAKVEPAFVGLKDGVPYTVKTQNIVADLIAVVQMQQREIEELKRQLAQ